MPAPSSPRIEVRFHRAGSNIPRVAVRRLVMRCVEVVFDAHGWPAGQASVLLTHDDRLRQLNRTFRGMDEPTDILSFPTRTLKPGAKGMPDEAYLGDLAISLPYVQRHATEVGADFLRELGLIVVHGSLHLLGWDHATAAGEKKMWREQDRLLAVALDEATRRP